MLDIIYLPGTQLKLNLKTIRQKLMTGLNILSWFGHWHSFHDLKEGSYFELAPKPKHLEYWKNQNFLFASLLVFKQVNMTCWLTNRRRTGKQNPARTHTRIHYLYGVLTTPCVCQGLYRCMVRSTPRSHYPDSCDFGTSC